MVPEVERASEKELVCDRHRLRVGVDGPQEAGVERSLKNHYKHKVRDHSYCSMSGSGYDDVLVATPRLETRTSYLLHCINLIQTSFKYRPSIGSPQNFRLSPVSNIALRRRRAGGWPAARRRS